MNGFFKTFNGAHVQVNWYTFSFPSCTFCFNLITVMLILHWKGMELRCLSSDFKRWHARENGVAVFASRKETRDAGRLSQMQSNSKLSVCSGLSFLYKKKFFFFLFTNKHIPVQTHAHYLTILHNFPRLLPRFLFLRTASTFLLLKNRCL